MTTFENRAKSTKIALERSLAMTAPPAAGPAVASLDGIGAYRAVRGELQHRIRARDLSAFGAALAAALLLVVAFALYRTLEQLRGADIVDAMRGLMWSSIAGAAVATAGSYLALVGYDLLALRQVRARNIPPAFAALTSFISHSFTFMLGFGVLTGGAVRLRLYQLKGLEPSRILAVGLLCTLTFWIGLAALGCLCLVLAPSAVAAADGLSPALNSVVGALLAIALAGWIAYSAIYPRSVTLAGWRLHLPGPGTSVAAMAIGVADTGFAALALWLLLPQSAAVDFPGFVVIFAIATVLGVISHVPGGLGVFEAVIIFALPGIRSADAIGSLLLFRLIYYAAPFALATTALVLYEARAKVGRLSRAQRAFANAIRPFLAPIAAVSVFLGGFVLLVSGALPAKPDRLSELRDFVPLPFVETSHFVASIVGALLLIVGYGLLRRLRSAWQIAVPLIAAGAVFSLTKGIDFEEASICLAILALLWVTRAQFYRHAGLLEARPSREWLIATAIAIAFSVWIGVLVYGRVDYSNSLWWDFAYRGDAPRFLRASLGVSVTIMLVLLHKILHHAPQTATVTATSDAECVRSIVAHATQTYAQLAFIGDKQFLLSEAGDGFIMYGVRGSTWLAMGDPVAADKETVIDLIWRFKELADLHGGAPAFYQVSSAYMPLYIDAGFSFAKLGEEALVDLDHFTLDGSEGRKLRQSKAHAERQGLSFEIVPARDVPALLAQLKPVSDAWLAARRSKEKGFSLGFWSEAYLSRYDVAVIRYEGKCVAFANIWKSAGENDYSVDLMRHLPDLPNGTMDYLFICLLAEAKEEGYRWFNLGMAPLSGLPRHRLASLWCRFGALVYRHGSPFYNFQGLCEFKRKFKPEWRPKYLAHPGGLSMARVLMDATTLIASGPQRAEKQGVTR